MFAKLLVSCLTSRFSIWQSWRFIEIAMFLNAFSFGRHFLWSQICWIFLKQGAKTYQMAPTSPSNSPTHFVFFTSIVCAYNATAITEIHICSLWAWIFAQSYSYCGQLTFPNAQHHYITAFFMSVVRSKNRRQWIIHCHKLKLVACFSSQPQILIGGFDFRRPGVPWGMDCQQLAPPATTDLNDCVTHTTFLNDPNLAVSVDQNWGAECSTSTNIYAMTGLVSVMDSITSFTCCRIIVG